MPLSQTADLLFLLALLIFVFVGILRGFIKCFVGSARWIASAVLAYLFGGMLGELLNALVIGEWIRTGVFGIVDGMLKDAVSDVTAEQMLASFPQFLIGDSARETVNAAFAQQTGERLVSSVTDAIASPIASFISGILGYVTVFLLSLLLCKVVAWLGTSVAERIGILSFTNRFLGALWGALSGSLLLLAVAAVIKLFFRETEIYTDTVIVRWFCDSPFLSFLNF